MGDSGAVHVAVVAVHVSFTQLDEVLNTFQILVDAIPFMILKHRKKPQVGAASLILWLLYHLSKTVRKISRLENSLQMNVSGSGCATCK